MKRPKGEEKETSKPHLCEILKELLVVFKHKSHDSQSENRHRRTFWAKFLANELAQANNGWIQKNTGDELLFEFILPTRFFIHHIQVVRKFSISLRRHGISLDLAGYVWLSPMPRPPLLFPSSLYF